MKLPKLKHGKLGDYLNLRDGEKICPSESIPMSEKRNKVDTHIGTVDVVIDSLPSEVVNFTVSQRKDKQKYWLNFRSLELCEAPCFKFDSDGATHENLYDDIPLPLRSVPTPHFQWFDTNGRWFAYRTDVLNDATTETLLRTDLDNGLKHFCDIAKLRTSSGKTPAVTVSQPVLMNMHDDDPLNGVNFS